MFLLKKYEQTVNKHKTCKMLCRQFFCFFISASLSAVCLTACSRQESIDAYEFCRRYNSEYDSPEIKYEEFFKECKSDGCFYSFYKIGDKTALLTLDTDEKGTVTGIAATVTGEEGSYNEQELREFYDSYIALSSELMGVTSREAEKAINDSGIFFDNLKFCDIDYYCEKGRYVFSLLCNKYVITAYTGKSKRQGILNALPYIFIFCRRIFQARKPRLHIFYFSYISRTF